KRFDFMWDILSENALGLVLLIRANAPDPLQDLRTYAEEFRPLIDKTALVVGVTHFELADARMRFKISDEISRMGLPPVAMDTDARNRVHVATLVRTLIYSIDPFGAHA
ncbi:MAG: hypothetical protein IKH84_02720, partial [Ottowia sp.]|nr:hypothetical protein [Ottowia sp.]